LAYCTIIDRPVAMWTLLNRLGVPSACPVMLQGDPFCRQHGAMCSPRLLFGWYIAWLSVE